MGDLPHDQTTLVIVAIAYIALFLAVAGLGIIYLFWPLIAPKPL